MVNIDSVFLWDKAKTEIPEGVVEPEVVVRLRTSVWSDKSGIHMKKSLTYLKRKCKGFNFLDEEIENVGADETMYVITNIGDCPDGIYRVIICNEYRDWESGYIDSWDYKLVPYEGD